MPQYDRQLIYPSPAAPVNAAGRDSIPQHQRKDPRLPHLGVITHPPAMVEHFNDYLRGAGMSPGWQVSGCAVEKVFYHPAKSCGVLYRLHFCGPGSEQAEEWVYGQAFAPGRGEKNFAAVASLLHPPPLHPFLKALPAIGLWPQLDMVIWIFPADPALATLSRVTDPGFMRQQLEENLPRFGLEGKWRCEALRFDRIKHMAGKRCVLRFQAHLQGPGGQSRELRFYSKTSKKSIDRFRFDLLKNTYEQLQAQQAGVNIPLPLHYLEGYDTVWQADWGGQALAEVFQQYHPRALFPAVAATLAAFHRSRVEGLPVAYGAEDLLRVAAEDVSRLAYHLPEYAGAGRRMLTHLERTLPALQENKIPATPLHGACRMEQMLVKGEQIALVDFDALSLGDPLTDVAEFLISLEYLELSQGIDHTTLAEAGQIFLESYASLVPWPCDRHRITWYGGAFLPGKLYSALKNLHWPALQKLDSAGQALIERWFET